MENGPGLKMYFLLKLGIFHCYVSLPGGRWLCCLPKYVKMIRNPSLKKNTVYFIERIISISGRVFFSVEACVGVSLFSRSAYLHVLLLLGQSLRGPMSTIRIPRVQSLGVSCPGGTTPWTRWNAAGNIWNAKSLVVEWGPKKQTAGETVIWGLYIYTQIGFKLGL